MMENIIQAILECLPELPIPISVLALENIPVISFNSQSAEVQVEAI